MKEEILSKLLQYANSAELFASKNVPLYVEELLKYELYSSILAILIPALIIIMAAILLHKTRNALGQDTFSWEGLAAVATLTVLLISMAVFTINGAHSIGKIIKIKVAPRVFVIDYLRNYKYGGAKCKN